MGVLNRTKKQKQAINILIGCLATAIGLILIMLFINVNQLADISSEISSTVKVGPLSILQIQKIPVKAGGYQATLKINSGLFVYIGIWFLMSTFLIVFRQKPTRYSG